MAFEELRIGLQHIVGEAWADPSVAFDVSGLGDVEIQVDGVPTTPYQPQRSLNGTTFYNCPAYDEAGNVYTTITAPGIYSLSGQGFVKFSAGAGSILTRRAGS